MKDSVGKCRFTDTIPPLKVVKILSLFSVLLDLRGRDEAKLRGEVFQRFIRGWLQTGVDRRRIKGV
jgi:hypothetical protein